VNALAVQRKLHYSQDLQERLEIHYGDIVFNADNNGVVIDVDLLYGGEAAEMGGTVAGAVICPDGSTVALTGSSSGNTVSIALDADCVAIPGQIGVGIQVVNGTTKTTVFKGVYNVDLFETDNPVDPGSRTSLQVGDLIDDIETAIASIPADYSDLLAAIAPTFSTSTAYNIGQYVWYDGDLYRFTTSHTAGSWNSAHVSAAVLTTDMNAISDDVSDLKSALTNHNSINVLEQTTKNQSSTSYNGTTYTITDGMWSVSGTTSANFTRKIFESLSVLPAWFAPGKTIYIRLNKTGSMDSMRLVIYPAYNGAVDSTALVDTRVDMTYTVPSDYTGSGLVVRLFASKSVALNGTVFPEFLQAVGNDELLNDIMNVDAEAIKFVSDPSTAYDGKTLAEVDDNVRMIVSKGDFSDIPYAGQCMIFKTSTSYNVQILFRNTTGAIFTRIVNRSNHTVYRDWAQHALLSDVDGKYDSVTRFDGKKIYCDGDSMMLGVVTSSPRVLADLPVYANIQERIPGATVYNASHGGDTIISRDDTDLSICDSILADDTVGTYDYFVINGGTNDFTFDATIGTIDSTDETEFYGALNAIMQYILTENPKARVMLITPLFRNYSHTLRGNAYNLQNNAGSTLGDYCDAMINIGKKYCMPVFDSRCLGGVNEYNYETMLEKRDPSDPSPSQGIYAYLHPTNDCYTQYGNAIASYFIANN
jgi:lysophospholipase L1-like esterase